MRRLAAAAAALAGCAAATGAARAQSPFPAGTESKAAGLESTLASQGAPALLYNPANLRLLGAEPATTSKRRGGGGGGGGGGGNASGGGTGAGEPYAELGVVRVRLVYEHPEYDPVSVSLTSPTVTLGYAARVAPTVAVGLVVFPKKNGRTEIPGIPRKVGGNVVPLEVVTEDRVVDIATGASWRPRRDLSFGLALVHTVETHKLDANLAGNAGGLIAMDYRGQFTRPVAGARLAPIPGLTVATALKPAQHRAYKGTQKRSTDAAPVSPQARAYEPLTASLGLSGSGRGLEVGFEASHQAWRAGRGVVSNGLNAEDPEADLRDVTEYGLTVSYTERLERGRATLNAGIALLPSPWGDGYDDGELARRRYGADFGQLNGMDRKVLTLGGTWRAPLLGRALDVSAALYRAQGERMVGGSGDNVGYYSLGVTAISGAVRAEL